MMTDGYDRSGDTLNITNSPCPREEFSFKTASSSLICDHKIEGVRQIICRYGRGCTHMHDTCHRSKFWHPPMPALTGINDLYYSFLWNKTFVCLNLRL